MRKKLLIVWAIFLFLALLLPAGIAKAASNNDLIDDQVFDSTSSMSAAQIDTWLNINFPNSCISTNSRFTAPNPSGYSPDANFIDGHYTYGSPVSAGRIVYDTAVAHGVNPKVLLTKLQNEEGLVVGNGPYGCGATAMASAVGYACTDSGTSTHSYSYTGANPYTNRSALITPLYYRNGSPVNTVTNSCVNSNVKAGFSQQVVHAAWLLSFSRHKSKGETGWAAINGSWNHCEDNNSCPSNLNIPSSWACYSGFMTQGLYKRCPTDSSASYYDGYASIDGHVVHMGSGGTAALYVYTPHIQSFVSIFTSWFGNPTSNCESTNNDTASDSGRKILAFQYKASSSTSLTFSRMNNTGSACTELHLWSSGYKSWDTHITSGMRSTNPDLGELINGDFFGSGNDRLMYIRYSGQSGLTEAHLFSNDLKVFPGVYDVSTSLSNATPVTGQFVSGDFLGRGYDQLVYVKYAGAGGFTEIHMFSKDLRKVTGTYDVVTNLKNADSSTGSFIAGDFLGRGYDQLLYVLYNGASGKVEVHIFDRTLRKSSGFYDIATNLTSGVSPNTGTFVAGDFLHRGYDRLMYVKYKGSSQMVETHLFSTDLRKATGVQDIATNLQGYTVPL
jgi:hypothetical protein